jgi:hypothetical protein
VISVVGMDVLPDEVGDVSLIPESLAIENHAGL